MQTLAALIQAVGRDGMAASVPGKGRLQVVPEALLPDEGGDQDEADDSWGDDEDLDDLDLANSQLSASAIDSVKRAIARQKKGTRPTASIWEQQLRALTELEKNQRSQDRPSVRRDADRPRQVWYVLDLTRGSSSGWPIVSLWQRITKKDNTPGKLKPMRISQSEAAALPLVEDRDLIGLLKGNDTLANSGYTPAPIPFRRS